MSMDKLSRRIYERGQAQRDAEHRAYLDEQERERLERQRANAQARRNWRAKLDQERAARQAEAEAEDDRLIEGEKQRERRRWLAEHPGKTESDFERFAWPQLRPQIIERHNAALLEEQGKRLRESGLYDF